ncbi:hypothetical protein TWF788_008634 [Orbilia oligospora]|nr:hypothetical protein TWF788_008634 [Orbilia oligospora]KAF3210572.1 hypothetical protein TWF679_006773 [Orbilia oligospora]KAF3255925.1 hypothetical protein TWF192_002357 [Orbilia oligospora]
MPISWSSENYVKLLSALLAAHPELKPDYEKIAVHFGDGATYDAINNCMRRIRAKAEELRKEVETGVRPNVTPKPTPRKRNVAGQSKAKKGFIEEDGDDEEILTPSKKKAKLIEEGTPTSIKKEGNGGIRKKAPNSVLATTIIDVLDSDDENIGQSGVAVKREVNSAAVKTEMVSNTTAYDYDSEDNYRE